MFLQGNSAQKLKHLPDCVKQETDMDLFAITVVRPHTCGMAGRGSEKSKGSIPATMLADAIRQRYDAHGRSWTSKDVRGELRMYDEGAAKTQASHVLKILQRENKLPDVLESELAQGYAVCLQKRGWGVAFHTADYKAVQEQVSTTIDMLRSQCSTCETA